MMIIQYQLINFIKKTKIFTLTHGISLFMFFYLLPRSILPPSLSLSLSLSKISHQVVYSRSCFIIDEWWCYCFSLFYCYVLLSKTCVIKWWFLRFVMQLQWLLKKMIFLDLWEYLKANKITWIKCGLEIILMNLGLFFL